MKARHKARLLGAIGVCIGTGSFTFSMACGHRWWALAFNAFFYGMTCAVAGVTWWETRGRQ